MLNNLGEFRPELVFQHGELVARDGRFLAERLTRWASSENSVHLAPLDESAFRLRLGQETCPVIRIVPGQIITRREETQVRRVQGHWEWDQGQDVLLIASVERHHALGLVGLGLVSGFGLRQAGAIGSSVAHDSHNLIVAGTNGRNMLACVRPWPRAAVASPWRPAARIRVLLPLPVAGLLSTESAIVVCRQLAEVRGAAHALGCGLTCPFGILSFLALSVIPELRITDQGLWDVVNQAFVRL